MLGVDSFPLLVLRKVQSTHLPRIKGSEGRFLADASQKQDGLLSTDSVLISADKTLTSLLHPVSDLTDPLFPLPGSRSPLAGVCLLNKVIVEVLSLNSHPWETWMHFRTHYRLPFWLVRP